MLMTCAKFFYNKNYLVMTTLDPEATFLSGDFIFSFFGTETDSSLLLRDLDA